MKKIATLASAVTLAATSLSAGAWWGMPCMTQEQQRAMTEQQTKSMEQVMAARRRMAEQMTAQRAEMIKRMQAQGVDPMAMGFPGTVDPWGGMGPWGDMEPLGTMDPWGAADPWHDMLQPQIPAFIRDRYAELEAYRSRAMKESKARRDKMTEDMARRRREVEANRHARPRSTHPVMSPYSRLTTAPALPASAPQTKAPAQVSAAPAPKATPAPVTADAQLPAPEIAPVVPAPAATTPRD